MAEAAFKDEDNRYNRIEDTAHKYIPVMMFLVTVESYLAKWALDNLVPPRVFSDILGLFSITVALASLLYGIFLLFRAFHFEDVRLFRPDEKDVDFFEAYDLPTIYRAYAVRFNIERETNSRITDKKVKLRHWTYNMMLVSSAFLALTGFIYVVHSCFSKFSKCGRIMDLFYG